MFAIAATPEWGMTWSGPCVRSNRRLTVSRSSRLRVHDLSAFDDHDLANSLTQGLGLPANPAAMPPTPAIPGMFPVRAKVSFDVEWNGALATAEIENKTQQFKGSFVSTGTTISWSAEQSGFRFESDMPPDPKANLISVLGRERNGVFFS
jgi:hypothetical protein